MFSRAIHPGIMGPPWRLNFEDSRRQPARHTRRAAPRAAPARCGSLREPVSLRTCPSWHAASGRRRGQFGNLARGAAAGERDAPTSRGRWHERL